MIKVFTFISTILICFYVFSQTENIGIPFVKTGKIKEPKAGISYSFLNNEDLKIKYNSAYNKVYQYGEVIESNINILDESAHINTQNERISTYFIESQGALSMSVIFTEFNLVEGAYLYIINKDKLDYIGAYTSLNNNDQNELGTFLLPSDKIYIEIHEPIEKVGFSSLKIGKIIHGFKDFNNVIEKAFNDAGDCNIDVNCPQGSGWEYQRNSVVMIMNSTGGICTGAMVNNTSGVEVPYFLTANHCGNSPGQWSYLFRWESPNTSLNCNDGGNSTNTAMNKIINGGITRANRDVSDFHLIELNSLPLQAWDVVYAGWDKRNIPASGGAGIHHPSGDIKKIALSESNFTTFQTNYWSVQWSEGVTEPGSSGSPVFNSERRIVGQLFGGQSGCGSSNQSDNYGKFSSSWTGGGTNATRLSNWLDSDSTGVEFLDASVVNNLDAFFKSKFLNTGLTICSSDFVPSFIITNGGQQIANEIVFNYIIDSVSFSYTWNGSLGLFESDTVVFPSITLDNGFHYFEVTISTVNGAQDDILTNNVFTQQINVAANAETVTLVLDLDNYASETSWEVVDNDGNTIHQGGNYSDEQTLTIPMCMLEDCYDFKIYDTYGDGLSSGLYPDGAFYLTFNNDTLAQIATPNADFGNLFVENFCLNQGNLNVQNDNIAPIFLYPNPSIDKITINSNEQIIAINVIDTKGRTIKIFDKINAKTIDLNLDLETGIYFANIITEKNIVTKELIIHKK